MTDNEIIKALECCGKKDCKQCPAFDENIECGENTITLAIALINRLKRQSNQYRNQAQAQKGELTRLYKQITEQKAEIERLQKEGLQINEAFMGFVNKRKAEARKEFAEKLKEYFPSIASAIDYIAREMEGENHEQ